LKNKKFKSVAILGHTSADPDSIASAFGMAFIMESLHSEIIVDVLIDGISKHSTGVMQYYPKPFLKEITKKYDLFIIVDVNVLAQMGKFQETIRQHPKESIIIIDHHTPTDFTKDIPLAIIEDDKTSASEMVTRLIFDLSLQPDEALLTILLSGIIYDSRRFYSMKKELSALLSMMLELGADYDTSVSIIQNKLEKSERIARIKCASRCKLHRFNNWLIIWSKIGSHEGSSARALLSIGADVGLIITKRKKLTRLTVRATNNFYKKTNINFGKDIMQPLGRIFNGDGGGHSTAAALTILREIPEDELMNEALKLLEDLLTKVENKVVRERIHDQ